MYALDLLNYESEITIFMSYWMIFVGFVSFIILLKHDAPYGRYSNYVFGPPIPAKLAWFVMEFPPVLIFFLYVCFTGNPFDNFNYLFIIYIIHYVYRSIIYANLIKNAKSLPLLPFLMALVFNIYNGTLQLVASRNYNWSGNIGFINALGIVGFFVGMLINILSDHQLRQLRIDSSDSQRYKIPKGMLFEYVSCANYFGEILEWACFVLVMQSLASVAFALFTCFNLIPRALSHHRWYKDKFEDYPKDRKAVIPLII